MRYLVLMSDDGVWDRAGETEQQAIMAAHIAFSAAVGERATLVGGEALAAPAEVVTLRAAATGSDRVVTDGPYAETVEQLGGRIQVSPGAGAVFEVQLPLSTNPDEQPEELDE